MFVDSAILIVKFVWGNFLGVETSSAIWLDFPRPSVILRDLQITPGSSWRSWSRNSLIWKQNIPHLHP